jgi:hypothetical protein
MDCLICTEKLTLENCVNTECKHSFCNTCFWKWTKEQNSCPLCRSSILVNSEELKEHMHIKKMIADRTNLREQIAYFESKKSILKSQIEELAVYLNNLEKTQKIPKSHIDKMFRINSPNQITYVSNFEINERRLASTRRLVSMGARIW